MRSYIILLGILSFLYNGTTLQGQQDTFSIRAKFEESLSTDKLVLELDLLRNWIGKKAFDRTGFLFTSRDSFDLRVKELRTVLLENDSIDFINYVDYLPPLIHSVKDDHAFFPLLSWSSSEIDQPRVSKEKIVFPMEMVVFQNNCYLVNGLEIPGKSEILEINGIPALDIITRALAFYHYNSWYYLQKQGYAEFNGFILAPILFHLFGFEDEVTITFRENSTAPTQQVQVELQPFRQYPKTSESRSAFSGKKFDLRFKGDWAILEINSWKKGQKGIAEFYDFYNDAFKKIAAQGSQKLCIDISHNRGGSNLPWLVLLNYIYEGAFKFSHNRPTIELAELTAIYLDRKKKKKALKVLDLKSRFTGEVFLLIGPKTFSAATNMADFMKFNQIGTIWGIETPGWTTHYGQIKEKMLPYSQIDMHLSGRLFYDLQGRTETGGVVPHKNTAFEDIDQFWRYYLDHQWADILIDKL